MGNTKSNIIGGATQDSRYDSVQLRRKDEIIRALQYRNDNMREQIILAGAIGAVVVGAGAALVWRHVSTLQKSEQTLQATLLRHRSATEEGLKRLHLDFQVQARQMEVDKKYAVQGFSRSMLEVADNLERALKDFDKSQIEQSQMNDEQFVKGIRLVEKGLLHAFERHGITKMDHMNQPFDPNFHEAMVQLPGEGKPGTIGEVFQSGYLLHDRVLRPAHVGIFKSESKDTQDANGAECSQPNVEGEAEDYVLESEAVDSDVEREQPAQRSDPKDTAQL